MAYVSDSKIERISFMGLPMDKVSLDGAIDVVERFIDSGSPNQIVVLNAAKIVKARSDERLKQIIMSADLIGPDGVPLVWVSKLLRNPLPGRLNGTDFMEKLVEVAAQKGHSIYFFGARQEIVEKVVEIYTEQYPTLEIAGFRNGYFSPDQEPQIVEEIRSAKPDILFIALGTPMKEEWVNRNLQSLNVPVCHGVGGSFDVVAGLVSRAPVWMQKSGLEWAYRLYQEPRKMWKRYLVTNTAFIFLVMLELAKSVVLPKRVYDVNNK